MNPQTQDQDDLTTPPTVNPEAAPDTSSPEANEAALQAIEALESESTTEQEVVSTPQPAEVVEPAPTPSVSQEPAVATPFAQTTQAPVTPAPEPLSEPLTHDQRDIAPGLAEAPVTPIAAPTAIASAEPKKKAPVTLIVLIVLVVALLIVGFFAIQSL